MGVWALNLEDLTCDLLSACFRKPLCTNVVMKIVDAGKGEMV